MSCFKENSIDESYVLISYNISEYGKNYPQQLRRFLLSEKLFDKWPNGLDTFFKKKFSSQEEIETFKNELCKKITFIKERYSCKIFLSIFLVNGKDFYYENE